MRHTAGVVCGPNLTQLTHPPTDPPTNPPTNPCPLPMQSFSIPTINEAQPNRTPSSPITLSYRRYHRIETFDGYTDMKPLASPYLPLSICSHAMWPASLTTKTNCDGRYSSVSNPWHANVYTMPVQFPPENGFCVSLLCCSMQICYILVPGGLALFYENLG